MMKPAQLVVLISGSGTNLQAILDASQAGDLHAQVSAVISNKAGAYGLEHARQAAVPAIYHPKPKDMERQTYDKSLAELIQEYSPDYIILAGWMRVLSNALLEKFPNRVINFTRPFQAVSRN